MPKIQIGDQLVEIVDCPDCGRTVIKDAHIMDGFIAKCGKRLINVNECALFRVCPEGAPSTV